MLRLTPTLTLYSIQCILKHSVGSSFFRTINAMVLCNIRKWLPGSTRVDIEKRFSNFNEGLDKTETSCSDQAPSLSRNNQRHWENALSRLGHFNCCSTGSAAWIFSGLGSMLFIFSPEDKKPQTSEAASPRHCHFHFLTFSLSLSSLPFSSLFSITAAHLEIEIDKW